MFLLYGMIELQSGAVNLVDWAGSNGHLRYLKYAQNTLCLAGTKHGIHAAAFCGHFNVVRYLPNQDSGATSTVYLVRPGPVQDCDLEIVKILYANKVPITPYAIEAAAEGRGNLEMFKFFRENFDGEWSGFITDNAADAWTLDIVEFLHGYRTVQDGRVYRCLAFGCWQ